MQQISVLLSQDWLWALAGFALSVWLLFLIAPILKGTPDKPTAFDALAERLGVANAPTPLVLFAALLWALITLSLITGLLWTILSAAFHLPTITTADQTNLRFILITLTALTATLGATVAFPFTLIRLRLTHRQTTTAEESLFNDKINAAAADLAARHQTTRLALGTKTETILTEWTDDLVTRAAAIDRLEGLANERPDTAARVARMLSIYVRELSREHEAIEPPKDATPNDLWEWSRTLTILRPDMEKAAQTLGRLQNIQHNTIKQGDIDLRHANLQRFDLGSLNFQTVQFDATQLQGAELYDTELQDAYFDRAQLQGADLNGARLQYAYLDKAQLQGADLSHTQLQGADLANARLQEADLSHAQLQGADLTNARLRGADLSHAELQGASLNEAQLDENTAINYANFLGVAALKTDDTTIIQLRPHWPDIFADGTVQLPKGTPRPDHWSDETLDGRDFYIQWRAWQATLPAGWDK